MGVFGFCAYFWKSFGRLVLELVGRGKESGIRKCRRFAAVGIRLAALRLTPQAVGCRCFAVERKGSRQMDQMTDIQPLAEFLRDHTTHLERLAATGRPKVLTVNGEALVVVQDAASYQKLLDALEAGETERIVRERLASLDRGESGGPAERVLADVRKRL